MTAYRDAIPADGPALAAMGRLIFAQTFAAEYAPAPFAAYLDHAYGPDGLIRDLTDPAITFRIAVEDDAIIGYAKLSALTLPVPTATPDALELRQLYIRRDRHGAGVAQCLMDWTIATARDRGARELYLAVFDFNHRACAFYARQGFVDVGSFEFRLGNRIDRDRIWRLGL